MENISVYIRLKPTKEKVTSSFSYDTKTITNSKTNEVFTFDYVISPTQTNKDIFEKLIKQNLIISYITMLILTPPALMLTLGGNYLPVQFSPAFSVAGVIFATMLIFINSLRMRGSSTTANVVTYQDVNL